MKTSWIFKPKRQNFYFNEIFSYQSKFKGARLDLPALRMTSVCCTSVSYCGSRTTSTSIVRSLLSQLWLGSWAALCWTNLKTFEIIIWSEIKMYQHRMHFSCCDILLGMVVVFSPGMLSTSLSAATRRVAPCFLTTRSDPSNARIGFLWVRDQVWLLQFWIRFLEDATVKTTPSRFQKRSPSPLRVALWIRLRSVTSRQAIIWISGFWHLRADFRWKNTNWDATKAFFLRLRRKSFKFYKQDRQ